MTTNTAHVLEDKRPQYIKDLEMFIKEKRIERGMSIGRFGEYIDRHRRIIAKLETSIHMARIDTVFIALEALREPLDINLNSFLVVVGKRITERKKKLGMSRTVLSGLIPMSYHALSQIEKGRVFFQMYTILDIARALDMPIEKLLAKVENDEGRGS